MTNNALEIERISSLPVIDLTKVLRVQKWLFLLHRRLGNWRGVGRQLNVHHRYAWNLALHGVVPANPDIRVKLGLPRVMPSERKPRKRREPIPKVWESPERYLKTFEK